MKQRIYLPEELEPYKKKFKFFFDSEKIYVVNSQLSKIWQFQKDDTVWLPLNGNRLQICQDAIKYWKEYFWQTTNLLDVHNAVMKAYLNQEKNIDADTILKYL